jgi:CRISPR-associated Csx10 family RAMP protein
MATLTVTLTLASPLLVGEPHRGNTYQSYSYLPGSVLRGAVAAVLMADWTYEQRQVAHPEACPEPATCAFCHVLYPQGGRPPRFYDCYPAVLGSTAVQPLPHTARTCKRFPGFWRAEDPDEGHGIFDTLIAQVAAWDAAGGQAATPYAYGLDCPVCDQALKEPEAGYYGRSGADFYIARPINRRFSRTAINRRRHTTQAGQLFTLTVMGEQMKSDLPDPAAQQEATRLEGVVDVGDADEKALREALTQVRWLGSGNSRGLGQVAEIKAIRSLPAEGSGVTLAAFQAQLASGDFRSEPGAAADLGNRLAAFNQAAKAERDFYRALGVDVLPGRWYFTIDLLSDTFVRQYGRPALALTAGILGLKGAKEDFTAVEPVERGGWSNVWGLPRPRELGIRAGGVFLFRVDNDTPAVVEALFHRLDELEKSGFGMAQERGAGRVMACAPFHQEVKPR